MTRSSRHAAVAAAAVALTALAGAALADPTPPPGSGGRSYLWEAGSGAALRLPVLPGASPLDSASLPAVDTSPLPGSRVALLRGVTVGRPPTQTTVQAVCVRAPGANLPPDVDSVAFEKLNEGIQRELARSFRVDSFTPSGVQEQGHVARQTFVAEGGAPAGSGRPGKLFARGKNQLGYVGEPPELLLCSVTCAQLAESDGCGPIIEAALLEAHFVPAPQPGLLTRLGFAVVRRPLGAVGALVGLLLLVGGIAVAAWPARRSAAA